MILRGDIDEIRFRNEENGFTIAVLDVGGDPVVTAGVYPPVCEGQTVEAEGEYVMHKRYGRQFRVDSVRVSEPEGVDGVVRYLGSGLIRGIGPALALRIASHFGTGTFDVIEYNPGRLAEVRGISRKKAAEIAEAYGKIKGMQKAIMTLQSYDVPLGTAMKIFRTYGDETTDVIEKNPYRLIEDVDGIGFLTADRIAARTGIEKDSGFRMAAGLIYTLKESVGKAGNTCYPKEDAITEAARILGLDPEAVRPVVDELVLERRVRPIDKDGDEYIALTGVARTEKNAAVLLNRLIESADETVYDVGGDIAEFERISGIKLHEKQAEAVRTAISSGVALITGGPGTGKTTIIRCMLEVFDRLHKTVMLMAPTGRAAKRMSEATGRDASTIHRACKFGTDLGSGEKLTADVIIVDEFSMVDIFLFEALLTKLPTGARLVLVGDKDQLPSVGAGNVLADIMRSGAVPTIRLDRIYRQAKESLIVTNAHAVNRGEMPELSRKDADFFFVSVSDPVAIAEKTVDMVGRAAKFIGVSPDRVQVLCPLKAGAAGAINVNRLLQKRLNGEATGPAVTYEDYTYRAGDKVMHIVNNYDLEWKVRDGYLYREGTGVYNGDIGRIESVDSEKNEITVEFEDGRVAVYTPDVFGQLVLAYAITVHKSQGSEFDAVILPLVPGAPMLLTRNLLYTAITRARRMVVIVGERYTVKKMVENDYIAARYSMLCEYLTDAQKDSRLLFGRGKE